MPCCDGQHFIKFIDGKAVIPTWEFFQIVRHYEKNIRGIVCSSEKFMWYSMFQCHSHRKLDCLHFFSNNIRQKIINNNIIITKNND